MTQGAMIDMLAERARAIAGAGSAAAVFKALLEASRAVAPRTAVFLVRQGEIQGWGSFGYPSTVAQLQRGHRAPRDAGWLAPIAAAAGAPATDATQRPDFGQPVPDQWIGCTVSIDGRPIAALVAERDAGEAPWQPEGLALLACLAELRLELDLARRRAALATQPSPARPYASQQAPPEALTSPVPLAAPASSLSPAAPAGPAAHAHADQLEPARRYARLVATDIRLYNEEAVMAGRRNGDLAERLGEHLSRGRETFVRRHGDLGSTGLELLHEAYVQVLAGGDSNLIPPKLLG